MCKQKKRVLLMAAFLVVAMLVISNTKSSAKSTLQGQGTKENPYQVYTLADFQKVEEDMNAYYIQMNDIDLASGKWNPIGSSAGSSKKNEASFSGEYNGNNKMFYNFRGTNQAKGIGMFLENQGTIKNVNIKGVTLDKGNQIGILAKKNAYTGLITNCHIENIKVSNVSFFGGIVYENNGIISNCTVKNGTIEGKGFLGGIAGRAHSRGGAKDPDGYGYAVRSKIEYCSVDLKIIGKAQYNSIGGVVGESIRADINSTNVYGSITSAGGNIGGMIGDSTEDTIRGCNSKQTITVNGEGKVGGAIGKAGVYAEDIDSAIISEIEPLAEIVEQCVVESNLITNSLKAEKMWVGGIIGYVSYTKGEGVAIHSVTYKGNIETMALSSVTKGGIVGYIENSGKKQIQIRNAIASGKSYSNKAAKHTFTTINGGIVGYAQGATVSNSESYMNVEGNYTGGIFGQADDDVIASYCLSSGEVRDTSKQAKSTVRSATGNVINTNARLKAQNYTGAIAGSFSGAKISNTYNNVGKTKQKQAIGIKLSGKVTVTSYDKAAFSQSSYSLWKGDSTTAKLELKPTSLAKKKVVYTSNNTSVVTVNKDGKLVAKGTGKATITATIDKIIKVDCKVTVVNGQKLSAPNITSKKSGKTEVSISWKSVAGATQYEIQKYDNKTKKYKTVKKVGASTNTFKQNKIATKTKHEYRVRAIRKKSGKTIYSSYSKKATVKL